MDTNKKTTLFESAPVGKAVMTMAIPTVISSLVMVIYNLADTFFVGMLNDPIQNAAVTLAAPVLLAFNAINNLFGVGSSSMMSRALGKKDIQTVKESSSFGFYCSLFFAVIFSVMYTAFKTPALSALGADGETAAATAGYLKCTVSCGAAPAILNVVLAYMVRAEGSSLHASLGTMSGCLLNIILDPFFILPGRLGMGAEGAGLATFIANCFACVYFFVLLAVRRKNTYVCVNPKKLRFKKAVVLGIFAVGVPAAIQNLLNVTGMTVLNNLTASFGSDAVAAMGIAQKVNMVPLYVALGLSQGIMPLISYNYASGNTKRMKKVFLFSSKIVMAIMLAVTAAFYIDPKLFVSMFIGNEGVIEYGAKFLHGLCLCLPFLCMDFLAVGVFQACGMGAKALVFALLRKILLEIPALLILNRIFPLYGLAYAQPAAEIILSVVAVIILVRMFKKLENESSGIS